LWSLYVALEPLIRRRWPRWIISWSRLLAGDFRDPLVGRDILIGAAIGAVVMLVLILLHVFPKSLGRAPTLLLNPGSSYLGNLFFLRVAMHSTAGLFQAFISVFLLLLFVVILRRERLAVLALWLLLTVVLSLTAEATWTTISFAALATGLVVFTLVRFGLLAVIMVVFFSHLIVFYPVTTELTAWYALDFTIALVIAIALAAYGFYISLGGQKLLPGTLLEE
jgi:serine/threonine-protein kinase